MTYAREIAELRAGGSADGALLLEMISRRPPPGW
jgi:hypothetical protein